jgi:hypothetical protein
MDIDAARELFLQQRKSALMRQIPFRLTFAEWLDLIGDKLDQMGSGTEDYYLERTRPADGFVPGNVRISKRMMR